jgi:hypothetical protein
VPFYQRFSAGAALAAAAGLSLALLTACSSGSDALSPPPAPGGDGGAASAAAAASSAIAALAGGQTSGTAVDGCTLVTAQQLSQAAGVTYTKLVDSGIGTICNVTGASPADSFYYHVDKEDGAMTTWAAEVATIKEDDDSETSVPGLGDQAAQGFKEFAAESKGRIVVVVNADVNNPPTASSFTRTKKIEKLLISKL